MRESNVARAILINPGSLRFSKIGPVQRARRAPVTDSVPCSKACRVPIRNLLSYMDLALSTSYTVSHYARFAAFCTIACYCKLTASLVPRYPFRNIHAKAAVDDDSYRYRSARRIMIVTIAKHLVR